MRKFTKVLALVLALTLVIGVFAGCGKKDGDSNGTTATAETNEKSGKKYVIYSDNAFPPFEYLDEQSNSYVGIDMDILAAVAQDQGFEYEVRNEGFDASMGAVQSGQADAMIAGMTITDERKETFDFSDGYYEEGQIMVVAANADIKSVDDLKGTNVAVKNGTAGADYAKSIKDKIGFEITNYDGSPEMYQAVITGTNSACFEDKAVIIYSIEKKNLELKTVGETMNPKEYGFAVKKGSNAELLAMFNKGLANIKANGKYDEILAKYGL